ncbi:U4/U6 small nuclear ribonucleoprotein Prp31 [Datura stramonium]|uniref:U4/U6 small nuclear ribonucleoprotein Prp31 n=1 Tax=Datura stramonium TaxID=4076 RepID=A0ABS8SYT7_DATST|nr:U4/U6 small nuclear ribonucleoprotein Prp31 [Datura stramonium]
MVVSVTASTTSGKPLPEHVLQRTLEACDRTLALHSAKKKVLDFVESRMKYIAPNLSAVVGSAVAAKLMCSAGGLSSLAFRMDLSKTGRVNLREVICKRIEKWQELPPGKKPKPLPVPDFRSKKQRGGRRQRKKKEKYNVTDAQKLRNRVQFGVPEESSLGDGLGVGYGMLSQAGSSKLRISSAHQRKKIVKMIKAKSNGSSGAATSGLSSSFAFTPVQGIQLSNPQAHSDQQLGNGTQSTYFSETGTFSKIKKRKSINLGV